MAVLTCASMGVNGSDGPDVSWITSLMTHEVLLVFSAEEMWVGGGWVWVVGHNHIGQLSGRHLTHPPTHPIIHPPILSAGAPAGPALPQHAGQRGGLRGVSAWLAGSAECYLVGFYTSGGRMQRCMADTPPPRPPGPTPRGYPAVPPFYLLERLLPLPPCLPLTRPYLIGALNTASGNYDSSVSTPAGEALGALLGQQGREVVMGGLAGEAGGWPLHQD